MKIEWYVWVILLVLGIALIAYFLWVKTAPELYRTSVDRLKVTNDGDDERKKDSRGQRI